MVLTVVCRALGRARGGIADVVRGILPDLSVPTPYVLAFPLDVPFGLALDIAYGLFAWASGTSPLASTWAREGGSDVRARRGPWSP